MLQPPQPPKANVSFGEFVVLLGLMMGLVSLSIDNILPAFGPIQQDFAIPSANEMQLIVSVYMAGFGLMQIVYGPLSDFIGRRPAVFLGLGLFLIGVGLAVTATSFPMLLAARVIQGMGGAAMRVLSIAIVRDRFEGREMARAMSVTMMIFIIVPIFAPAIGSFFIMFGSWRYVFVSMLALAAVIIVWFGTRMPETLHPEYRFPFSMRRVIRGIRHTVTNRAAFGYATAIGLMTGCIMTYVNSAQQIFETEVFKLGHYFPIAFGLIALVMGVGFFMNARLVRRWGMRRLSHGGTTGFVVTAALMLLVALVYNGVPPLWLFGLTLAANQFLFALTMPNFNAMAMEPLGEIAGTASSFIGTYSTLMGAVLGMIGGQAFSGTVIPMAVAYLVLGIATLGVVAWAERGRLFHPHHEAGA